MNEPSDENYGNFWGPKSHERIRSRNKIKMCEACSSPPLFHNVAVPRLEMGALPEIDAVRAESTSSLLLARLAFQLCVHFELWCFLRSHNFCRFPGRSGGLHQQISTQRFCTKHDKSRRSGSAPIFAWGEKRGVFSLPRSFIGSIYLAACRERSFFESIFGWGRVGKSGGRMDGR